MGKLLILEDFYEKLETSTTMWVNQPEPKGFGNAVLMAQPFVQNESCLVHAGDSCIISKDMDYLKKLLEAFERFNADAAFLVLEIENPKQYGIVEGDEVEPGIIKVKSVVEKPEKPKTTLGNYGNVCFSPSYFQSLRSDKAWKKWRNPVN